MAKKTVIAKVVEIRERTSSRGQPFWVVDFEGPDGLDSAYLWSKTVRQQLEGVNGSPVALTIEMRGEFPRVVEVTPVKEEEKGVHSGPVANQTTGMDPRDEFIARGVAMKAAATIHQGTGASAIQVLETAQLFLRWLRDPDGTMKNEIWRHITARRSDD